MPLLDTAWQDARRGARSLARTPSFTLAALLTLALGIGAISAIFTVINAVLLAPLPYQQPERRVMIYSRWTGFDKTWLSAAEGLDYGRLVRAFAGVGLWSTGSANLTGDGEPIRVGVSAVTANAFDVLGSGPMIGRGFTALEDRPGHDRVAILSYGLWRSRYAGDPGVLNRSIEVNGVPRTVVGVMPAGFRLPTDYGEDAADPTQLWVPLALDPATVMQTRGNHGLYGAAVLRPGATPATASAELAALTSEWSRQGLYPPAMKFTAIAVALDDEILGGVRPAMWLLAGAVAFLLLIACANVASLILARAEGRHRELALRCALGAGHRRLVRQLLTEGFVLSLASGALGLLLGSAGVRLLLAIDPTIVPRADAIGVDLRVLGFTVLMTIVTTGLFSLAPAIRLLRLDLNEALKDGSQHTTVGGGRHRLRGLLVVTEVALAVILAIGAVLMVQSLWALRRIPLGFDPAQVLTARVTLPEAGYGTPEEVVSFYARLLDRVRALPGVATAGAVRALPLAHTIGDFGLTIGGAEGLQAQGGHGAQGDWQIATAGAAEALRERLVRGRLLAPTDTTDSQLVVVINEAMARRYWPGRDAVGGRLRIGRSPERPWLTVVGIVGDQKHNGIEGLVKAKFYVAHPQWHKAAGGPIRSMTLVVRTTGDPVALAPAIRGAVRDLDAALPVASVRPMTDVVAAAIATTRFTGWLMAIFAGLAVVLSAVGLYGVLSFLVSQRRHEIGILMALGAEAGHVVRMVVIRGLGLALAGIGIGLCGAFLLTRFLEGMLRGVEPTEPTTFAGVAAVLAVVAVLASYVPARRASRVDPLVALRTE